MKLEACSRENEKLYSKQSNKNLTARKFSVFLQENHNEKTVR